MAAGSSCQRIEIGVIAHVVGKRHVEAWTGPFARKVLVRVDRVGGDIVAASQQWRAVASVHVAIDDEDALHVAFSKEADGGERQIVEHAIARTRVVQCMVAAASGVRGIAMIKGELGCCPGRRA